MRSMILKCKLFEIFEEIKIFNILLSTRQQVCVTFEYILCFVETINHITRLFEN